MQKVRVVYSGRVQGVGFRMTAYELARKHSVYGTVCNLSDGSVELVAVGHSKALMDYLQAIDQKMSRNIVNCTVDWLDAANDEFSDFSIIQDKLRGI
jgi:acylphosphatase